MRWLSAAASGALATALVACGGGSSKKSGGNENFRVAGGSQPTVKSGSDVPGVGSLTAYVARTAQLRASPGGRVVAQLRKRTSFGSPRVLAVADRRNGWLGVLAPELNNGAVGWIPARQAQLFRIPYSLEIDLSSRRMVARRDGKTVTSTTVAIGKPSAPTPRGTFAVTDRLLTRGGSPYGCCVLALTAHQPHIPQGWGGGNAIAIHSTLDPTSIGRPVSLGCIRADTFHMRKLMKVIPIGTVVRVRA
jgi:lipoprotein-anchoring transpeptidase ErfK/SrfK